MITVSIKELKQKLSSGFIETLNGNICTITKNGRICGALIDMNGRDDLEDFLLANDKKFVELVRKSFANPRRYSMEDLERELQKDERREARKKRRKAA